VTAQDRKRYADWPGGSQPFWPDEVVHHLLAVLGLLLVLAVVVFWVPDIFMSAEVRANPMETPEHIKPEWYFLPAYQLLKLVSSDTFGGLAELVGISLSGLFVLFLLLLPFVDRSAERDIRKRPAFLSASIGVVLFVIALGVYGHLS
jgi:ubiquinol-cytochrome c reductase cytochrome b subunit